MGLKEKGQAGKKRKRNGLADKKEIGPKEIELEKKIWISKTF